MAAAAAAGTEATIQMQGPARDEASYLGERAQHRPSGCRGYLDPALLLTGLRDRARL